MNTFTMAKWQLEVKGANSMAASGLVFRSDLVGTGRAISILFGIELETSNLTL